MAKKPDRGEDDSLARYATLVRRLSPDTLRILVRDAPDRELALAALFELHRVSGRAPTRFRSNADRIAGVEPSFSSFVHSHGIQDEDVTTQCGDLICDALHLCEGRTGDPFRALRQGIGNYAAEVVDEDGIGPDLIVEIRLNGKDPLLALEEAHRLYAELTGTTPASSPPSE